MTSNGTITRPTSGWWIYTTKKTKWNCIWWQCRLKHTNTLTFTRAMEKNFRRERIKLSFSLGNVYWIYFSHANDKNERQNNINWEIKGTIKWQSDNSEKFVVWSGNERRRKNQIHPHDGGILRLLIIPCFDNINDIYK